MHKQVSGWTVNFGPKFPESPFLELKTRKPPHPPFRKTSDSGWPKFTPEYPPQFWETSDLGWPKFTPEYTPPFQKTSDFGWPKFALEYPPTPPPPSRKTSDLGWPKFTPEYPPNENWQRVQVWDLQNTESYYMWRLYPTRITTSWCGGDLCVNTEVQKGHHAWMLSLSKKVVQFTHESLMCGFIPPDISDTSKS